MFGKTFTQLFLLCFKFSEVLDINEWQDGSPRLPLWTLPSFDLIYLPTPVCVFCEQGSTPQCMCTGLPLSTNDLGSSTDTPESPSTTFRIDALFGSFIWYLSRKHNTHLRYFDYFVLLFLWKDLNNPDWKYLKAWHSSQEPAKHLVLVERSVG